MIDKPATKEYSEEERKSRLASFSAFGKSTLSKRRQDPYSIYGFRTSSVFDKDYTIQDIEDAKSYSDVGTMRAISNFYFKTSSSYNRIIQFFATLYKYYNTLDLVNIVSLAEQKTGKNKIKKMYSNALFYLDSFNIEETFQRIATKVFVDGAFYGYVTKSENAQIITMLDPNYCRTRFVGDCNTAIVEFDVNFFLGYSKEEREAAFEDMPKIIKTTWNLLYGANQSNGIFDETRYAILPAEESCAFFMNDKCTPPMFDTIIDIINFNDYKDIEKRRDTQELQKLLVQRFKVDEDGNFAMYLDEIAEMHVALSEMVKNNPTIDVLTTIAESIELEDLQASSGGSVTNNNIQKMLVPKYENSGLSPEQFSATSATSLEISINNSTAYVNPLIQSFSNWLSMMVLKHVELGVVKPIVTILPVTWYNEKRMTEMYLSNAQSGYDKILPHVASGKKQSTLMENAVLQHDVLCLQDVLQPLQSSFTQSAKESSGGRPEKDPAEKSDKTNKNIESMSLELEEENANG